MATYYPCDESQSSFCILCNTAQDVSSSCTSSSSSNSSENEQNCSSYCNSGCNSSCNQPQTICVTHSQYIKDHADVGVYPIDEVKTGDFIHQKWSKDYWNGLINKINTAETIGKKKKQDNTTASIPSIGEGQHIVTADLYNSINKKICNFNVNYDTVKKDQIISATIANATRIAYNTATFDSGVCDACNSDQTQRGGCGCNCSCSCSCNCGCDCPCPCECDCDCDCNCGCGCSCSCNCGCSCSANNPT